MEHVKHAKLRHVATLESIPRLFLGSRFTASYSSCGWAKAFGNSMASVQRSDLTLLTSFQRSADQNCSISITNCANCIYIILHNTLNYYLATSFDTIIWKPLNRFAKKKPNKKHSRPLRGPELPGLERSSCWTYLEHFRTFWNYQDITYEQVWNW